jgi:hypothetical protein
VLVGMSAISWVVLVAMVGAWPLVGVLVYYVRRSWRRHDERYGTTPHSKVESAGE